MSDGHTLIWFQIAERIGCTVGEALQRVSSTEFNLWHAYLQHNEKEKWRRGADPSHFYHAQLAGMVATALSEKTYGTSDFLLEFGDADDAGKSGTQSADEIKRLFMAHVGK